MSAAMTYPDPSWGWPADPVLPFDWDFDERVARQLGPRRGYTQKNMFDPFPRHSLHFLTEQILLPANARLGFVGVGLPDIRARGEDIPDDYHDDDEALPPCVTGDQHVCILGFGEWFMYFCQFVEASTTAHRRYKGRLPGERIHIRLDGYSNNARMHMSDRLRDALNDSYVAWVKGR